MSAHPSPMNPNPPPTAAPPTHRPRLAGLLFFLGGLLFLVSIFLPWMSFSTKPGIDCSACSNGTYAPPGLAWAGAAWAAIRDPQSYGLVTVLGLLFLVALPLAYAYFGARLLTRPAPVRGRWKVFAILGSLLLLLAILILMLLMSLADIDATAIEKHTEFGMTLAWWPPIILIVASFVLPARWRATRATGAAAQLHA